MASQSLYFFAGELSGDMYGAHLIKALKQLSHFDVHGVAGPDMRKQGVTGCLRMEDFGVMGYSDVLCSLPRLWKQFKQVRNEILEKQPSAVIFIDSPSFSLRMAKALRKAKFKGEIVQYICPSVWAWGKKRIPFIAEYFDLLMTIYPFEAQYFKKTTLHVEYIGHPLQEVVGEHQYASDWQMQLGIKEPKQWVGIFPGSRKGEIQRNLPKQLEAAKLLKRDFPEIAFGISLAHEHNMELIRMLLSEQQLKENEDVFLIPKQYSYELMRSCRSAIAKSGTVTLELALHHCPTVVAYELTALNRFVAKYLLRVDLPYYCIVNIVSNAQVYPELIEKRFSGEDLYRILKPFHEKGKLREACIADCSRVKALLHEEGASARGAKIIVDRLL